MAVDKDKYVSTAMQLEAVQKENRRLQALLDRTQERWAGEKAKAEVYKQLDDANKSLVVQILRKIGVTADNPLRIDAEAVKEGKERGVVAQGDVDSETGEYVMWP